MMKQKDFGHLDSPSHSWCAEGQRTVSTSDSSTERNEYGIPESNRTKFPSSFLLAICRPVFRAHPRWLRRTSDANGVGCNVWFGSVHRCRLVRLKLSK